MNLWIETTREDLLAIKAYLFSLDPVNKQSPEHDLAWYMSTRLAASACPRISDPGAISVPGRSTATKPTAAMSAVAAASATAAADRSMDFDEGGFVIALARTLVTRRTGLWLCEQGGVRKEVYTKHGVPAFVTSNLAGELLGEYLVKKRVINRSELDMALAVMPHFGGKLGDTLVGPTLLKWGTEEQKQEFLPGILKGQTSWCQGFSEPNSGSDLASLKTSAVLDGDEWVINGQKVWTTQGHNADYCFLLTRTDPDAPKHRGISYMLVPMKQDGIEVRGIVQPDGTIDRPKLGAIIFADAEARKRLEDILHPAVRDRERELVEQIAASDGSSIVITEAALLYETGGAERYDRMVVVTAAMSGILAGCNTVAVSQEAAQPVDGCPVPAAAVIERSEYERALRGSGVG